MRVALYSRVSTEKQAQEGTIESQIVALREYAAANSYEILEECIDDGDSGTNLVHPGLERLRDLAHEGQIEAVVILSPDRLTRNLSHLLVIQEELEKQHVRPIFTNHRLGDTPEDKFLLNMQGAVSEYERTKILERTRRGRIQAAKKGHVIGGIPPYGYRLIHKTKDTPAHYEIHPLEADTLRLIFRLITEDKLSLRATAKYLNQNGIPPRSASQWGSSTLAGIVSNEARIGNACSFRHVCVEPTRPRGRTPYPKIKNTSKKLRPQTEWIPIPIEAIIDHTTFDAAQAQMALNIDRSPRNTKHNQYLLRC
jgi:site-specific DNA recombinase